MTQKKIISVILILALINVALLSIGHGYNSRLLLWSAILMFCLLVIISPKKYFLPLMLFYTPWSSVLRTDPANSSFESLIVPVVFIIVFLGWLKKEHSYKKEYFAVAFILTAYTLVVKSLNGLPLHMSYWFFILMLFFIPIYLNEYKKDIRFEECVFFLTAGILSACIASKILMTNPNMLKYIQVVLYDEVTYKFIRYSGFYGDPNYYVAHIIAAITGLMIIISKITRKGSTVLLIILIVALFYFATLSLSKMFILCITCLILLWLANFMMEKRKITYKIVIIVIAILSVGMVVFGNLFSEQINNYMIRFGLIKDVKSLTTGRSGTWLVYLNYLFSNLNKLFFGIGLSEDQVQSLLQTNNAHMTIIEILYQLGVIGGFFLLLWWKSIYQEIVKKIKMDFPQKIYFLIMAFSILLPWMALDMVYFHEFFYFLLLLFFAKNYLSENNLLRKDN
jgi:hypothetical protein